MSWTKFAQESYSHSKTEQVSITIEFCIFKLVYAPYFKLKVTILIFSTKFADQIYPKRVFVVEIGKSDNSPILPCTSYLDVSF